MPSALSLGQRALHAPVDRVVFEGATGREMQGSINLCFLFRGLSAAKRGAEQPVNIAYRERQEAAKAQGEAT